MFRYKWLYRVYYAELLRSVNISAKAVTSVSSNESVPELIKQIPLSFEKYIPTDNDKFILMDVSNPDVFDNIVRMNRIISVIDHHTGYEKLWNEKELNKEIEKSEIEFIGSVCTIIYEKFVDWNKTNLLTKDLCKLLTAAILDNTLNLKASITTDRDKKAYHDLMRLGQLEKTWPQEYFNACEKKILSDLKTAIIHDMKNNNEINLPNAFGQLTIFNSKSVLKQIDLVKEVFSKYDEWMINIISLEDGKSYIITNSDKSKKQLEKLFNKKFINDVMILNKFMLRKEIIKKARELSN